jgi:hypothetical protein
MNTLQRSLRLFKTPKPCIFLGTRSRFLSLNASFSTLTKASNTAELHSISKKPSQIAILSAFERNNDQDAVFVVTGGSRGLGFGFVDNLLKRTQGRVVALARNPTASPHLQELLKDKRFHNRLGCIAIDLTSPSEIAALPSHPLLKDSGRVDGLFNVAGILGNGNSDPGPERALRFIEVRGKILFSPSSFSSSSSS